MPTLARRISAILIFTLLWVILLISNVLPQIRGGYGWRWPYEVPDPTRLFPLFLGLVLYTFVAWELKKESYRARWLLLWAVVGTVGLTMAALLVAYDPFFELYTATLSGDSGGWHYAAAHIENWDNTLRNWTTYMPQAGGFSSHITISPPGMIIGYHLINKLLAQFSAVGNWLAPPLRAAQCFNYAVNDYTNAEFASTWAGILMPLWGGLTVFPMYRLGRRLFGETATRWAVCSWPLLPGLLIFSPVVNVGFPLLSTTLLALLLKGILGNKPGWVLVAGIFFSFLTFLMFAFIPFALMAGLLTLGIYLFRFRLADTPVVQAVPWWWSLKMGVWFGMGLSTVWVIYYLLYDVTIFEILQEATAAHLGLERPYWPWLFLHAYDYFIFSGWPFTLLAGWGMWQTIRKWHSLSPLTSGDIFTLAMALGFMILMVSGTLRGETGRILLYLSPFLLLIAGNALKEETRGEPSFSGWQLTVAQMGVVLVMIGFLRVGGSAFNIRPPLTPPLTYAPPPQPVIPNGAVVADTLHLRAFAGQASLETAENGQSQPILHVWLNWESTGQVDMPYWFSFIPVSPNGDAALEATTVQPFDWTFPTTCWLPDSGSLWMKVQIPLFTQADEWWVSLSLVDVATGTKAIIQNPDGSQSDQIGLGPFR